jgi:hypothetical protein
MSYSSIEILNNIQKKNVLILNIRTTEKIKEKGHILPPEQNYEQFTNNDFYDAYRITEIGYLHIEKFNIENKQSMKNIVSVKRKSESIKNENNNENDCLSIKQIFNGDFSKCLKECNYIIGYNIYAQISVLLNELFRKKKMDLINNLKILFENSNIICLGIIVNKSYKLNNWNKITKYQIPDINDVYYSMFESHIGKFNISDEIIASYEILTYFLKNKNITDIKKVKKMYGVEIEQNSDIDNFGKRWKKEEIDILMEELNSNIKINDIALNHGRTLNSVKKKIMTMAIDDIKNGKSKLYICETYKYNETMYNICMDKLNMENMKNEINNSEKINTNHTEKINTNFSNLKKNDEINNISNVNNSVNVQILAYLVKIDKKLDNVINDMKNIDNNNNIKHNNTTKHDNTKNNSKDLSESENYVSDYENYDSDNDKYQNHISPKNNDIYDKHISLNSFI